MTGTKKVAQRSIAKVHAYRKTFSGPDGQRVLLDLMAAHGMLHSTFPSDGDVNKMLIKEGERNVVLRILALLKEDPKKLEERIAEYEKSLE